MDQSRFLMEVRPRPSATCASLSAPGRSCGRAGAGQAAAGCQPLLEGRWVAGALHIPAHAVSTACDHNTFNHTALPVGVHRSAQACVPVASFKQLFTKPVFPPAFITRACLLAYTRMTESLSSSSSRIACTRGAVVTRACHSRLQDLAGRRQLPVFTLELPSRGAIAAATAGDVSPRPHSQQLQLSSRACQAPHGTSTTPCPPAAHLLVPGTPLGSWAAGPRRSCPPRR